MNRPGVSSLCVGVDVGGTNTDAVVLRGDDIIGYSKTCTTDDITSGVRAAIASAIENARDKGHQGQVSQVNIGTTHFINAVIQRKKLVKVAVLRLCGPASTAVPPFCDFPEDLAKTIRASSHFLGGGYEYDGREISAFDESEFRQCVNHIRDSGVSHLVISGVFSPVNPRQELQVAEILRSEYPDVSFTLSHRVGQISLLGRENAAILNESLKPLCQQTINAFKEALQTLGLNCQLYLTQNDGTIISADKVLELPVRTFSSGPTNSIRGAAFLSGANDAIVIDIGGTTSDFGCLRDGFPRDASTHVEIGGVRTNFRMPDVLSVGLGGGSHVTKTDNGQVAIGPLSCGYKLTSEGMVFGEASGKKVLTATDIAVAAGLVDLGDPTRVADLDREFVGQAVDRIHAMVESAIDKVKSSQEDQPVILVGGGSILVDDTRQLKGASKVIKPPYFSVANAVGAALSQVSGETDIVVRMDEEVKKIIGEETTAEELNEAKKKARNALIDDAKKKAIEAAVDSGAEETTVKIYDLEEIVVTYLTGNAVRYKVKAIGSLKSVSVSSDKPSELKQRAQEEDKKSDKISSTTTKAEYGTTTGLGDSAASRLSESDDVAREEKPMINEDTGEWILSEWDLDCITVGAGILGCGGGGNPYIGNLKTKELLKAGKKIRIITPDRMSEDGLVVMAAYFGAPLIVLEKLCNSTEMLEAFSCLQDILYHDGNLETRDELEIQDGDGVKFINNYPVKEKTGDDSAQQQLGKEHRKITGLLCAEVGGLNSVEPLYLGALLNLPVVDADCMGRAFPEFQMTGPSIYGKTLVPSCLVDEKGRRAVVLQADTPKHIENQLRQFVIEMGCKGGLASTPLSKKDVMSSTMLYSMSRACKLGQAVLTARRRKIDPIQVILQHENGKLLIRGKISDISRTTAGGFDKGRVTVEGFEDFLDRTLVVEFQNEHLVAWSGSGGGDTSNVVACVPDLIAVVDSETGEPITTDEVKYGLRVAVVVLASHPLLRTPEALRVVGPQAFGYPEEEVKFTPVAEYNFHGAIPPK